MARMALARKTIQVLQETDGQRGAVFPEYRQIQRLAQRFRHGQCTTEDRKRRQRSLAGLPKTCAGAPSSSISPSCRKITRSETSLAKRISWCDDDHRHALLRQSAHHIQGPRRSIGIERRGRLIEQHDLGLHGNARAIATRCCWPPDRRAG